MCPHCLFHCAYHICRLCSKLRPQTWAAWAPQRTVRGRGRGWCTDVFGACACQVHQAGAIPPAEWLTCVPLVKLPVAGIALAILLLVLVAIASERIHRM